MDELAKRRFERIAATLAKKLFDLDACIKSINADGHTIEIMLSNYLDTLEKVSGVTEETTRIRSEIEAAWKVFEDPKILPAIDAAKTTFDEASIDLGKLVEAIPKDM